MLNPTTAPAAPAALSLADGLRIIRAEFLESPGLHLTMKQAQRLWNLDAMTCDELLDALVHSGFLRRTHGDRSRGDGYVRADSQH